MSEVKENRVSPVLISQYIFLPLPLKGFSIKGLFSLENFIANCCYAGVNLIADGHTPITSAISTLQSLCLIKEILLFNHSCMALSTPDLIFMITAWRKQKMNNECSGSRYRTTLDPGGLNKQLDIRNEMVTPSFA